MNKITILRNKLIEYRKRLKSHVPLSDCWGKVIHRGEARSYITFINSALGSDYTSLRRAVSLVENMLPTIKEEK